MEKSKERTKSERVEAVLHFKFVQEALERERCGWSRSGEVEGLGGGAQLGGARSNEGRGASPLRQVQRQGKDGHRQLPRWQQAEGIRMFTSNYIIITILAFFFPPP